jgi:transposase
MSEVTTIVLDLAKHVFQVHGADASGAVVLRKQLRRGQVVALKTAEQHAALLLHRGRERLVRQRTSLVSALRAHLAGFGVIRHRGCATLRV